MPCNQHWDCRECREESERRADESNARRGDAVARAVAEEREACSLTMPPVSAKYEASIEEHVRRLVAEGRNDVDGILRLVEGAFGSGVVQTLAAIRARGEATS